MYFIYNIHLKLIINLNSLFMTLYQERKLSTYLLIQQLVSETSGSIIAKMPNFVQTYDLFKNEVSEINLLTGNQLLKREGNIIDKETARETMCEEASLLIFKVQGLAMNDQNTLLFNEVNYSKSALIRLPETACLAVCTIIKERVFDNLSSFTFKTLSTPYFDNSETSPALMVTAVTVVPKDSATFLPYEANSKATFLNFPSADSAYINNDIIILDFRF